ncbi:hypothetical protein HYPSUDRAFT_524924 [Hypholoma sublateritium FD-334 SS-4]|uniref:Choline/carnitine acyltransferase domain-containing protein n=1 Tax=Hypholoma sublateritium (strain FD-334 SS-4) TaxID=945553 RepID=A0A0D2P6Q7_HYPSF|nr:hypothetical protein HYPSUDRAFT_524924 [Hypholoma sublateritium FD-334 SS-4]
MLRFAAKRIPRPPPARMLRKSSSSSAPPPPPGYVADPTAPPMLRYQASLPPLPVPELADTCAKYLESVEPLLTPAALARTQAAVADFLASPLAAELQRRLLIRAADPDTPNWLSEWWNSAAYMGYRDPVVVFVSYFFVHVDDRLRRTPAARAASLLAALLPFRRLVETGELTPDAVRGAPLCMASLKWLFHAARHPQKPEDTATKYDPATHNHAVVLRKNRFFVLPLAGPDGTELSAAQFEAQVARIIDAAGEGVATAPAVGALTGDNRDLWADNREALLRASPSGKNAAALEAIDSAMIVLVLDDSKPVTREDISWATWVGNGRNRWYDKHQLYSPFCLKYISCLFPAPSFWSILHYAQIPAGPPFLVFRFWRVPHAAPRYVAQG